MAITYTENLNLAKQLDKTDYLDWDALTANWDKIDAAVSGKGGGSIPDTAIALSSFSKNAPAIAPPESIDAPEPI